MMKAGLSSIQSTSESSRVTFERSLPPEPLGAKNPGFLPVPQHSLRTLPPGGAAHEQTSGSGNLGTPVVDTCGRTGSVI
jgi:hypothetical protein